MSKPCKHDAYLAGMKHCDYGKTTLFKYYGYTPLETLLIDDLLTRNSKIGRPNTTPRFQTILICEKFCLIELVFFSYIRRTFRLYKIKSYFKFVVVHAFLHTAL